MHVTKGKIMKNRGAASYSSLFPAWQKLKHISAPCAIRNCGGSRIACLVFVFLVAAAVAGHAQTFNTLATFEGTSGGWPNAALVQGMDGNLYGTTSNGGLNNGGTVFQVTPAGTLATLYNFCSLSNCADGQGPKAGLIQGSDGNFYGTTYMGGSNGSGVIFKITSGGALTTLYSFCPSSNCSGGADPNAGLVQGADGNFYGTAERGGTGRNCGASGCGVVFKITPSGTFTVLHSFDSGDGSLPYAGLMQATDGNFYGTTYVGGTNNGGTLFQLTPGGALTTIYNFCSLSNCTDGTNPSGVLAEGVNGDLYGTAGGGLGGSTTDSGVVFQITTSGTMTKLYDFCSLHNCADGSRPYAGLVRGANGNLYGTTLGGGTTNRGTAFQITPSGALATLYNFCSLANCTDGWYPYAGLVQATNGTFYGTTYWGGACSYGTSGCGAIFSLSLKVALPPTIKPASVTFPPQALNIPSKAKVVTIKNVNTGSATLDLSGFTVSPPFAITANRCKATLAAGKSCSLSLTFTPTGAGGSTGTLSVTDNGPTTPQTVVLKGTGE